MTSGKKVKMTIGGKEIGGLKEWKLGEEYRSAPEITFKGQFLDNCPSNEEVKIGDIINVTDGLFVGQAKVIRKTKNGLKIRMIGDSQPIRDDLSG